MVLNKGFHCIHLQADLANCMSWRLLLYRRLFSTAGWPCQRHVLKITALQEVVFNCRLTLPTACPEDYCFTGGCFQLQADLANCMCWRLLLYRRLFSTAGWSSPRRPTGIVATSTGTCHFSRFLREVWNQGQTPGRSKVCVKAVVLCLNIVVLEGWGKLGGQLGGWGGGGVRD